MDYAIQPEPYLLFTDVVCVCVCLSHLFRPFPIELGFWNHNMLLLSKNACHIIFQNSKRSKVMAARSKKVIFSKIGTPPSVFELGLWNFQNVEIFIWWKNCMLPNFDLGPQNFSKNFWKWSKFWTFSLFELGPSNYCCL